MDTADREGAITNATEHSTPRPMSPIDPESLALLRDFAAAAAELRAAAVCHADCRLAESDAFPVERAVREVLGPAGEALDVLIAVRTVDDPAEHHFRRALAGAAGARDAERATAALRASGAERVVDCTVLAARAAGGRAAVTVRVLAAQDAGADDLALVLARVAHPPPVSADSLHRVMPRLSPHARLRVMHGPSPDGWTPLGCTIALEWPVRRTLQAGTNLAMLLGACDGRTSAHALYASFAAGSNPGDGLTEPRFADVLRQLILDGYLILDGPPGA